jgi:hypothetical protein
MVWLEYTEVLIVNPCVVKIVVAETTVVKAGGVF